MTLTHHIHAVGTAFFDNMPAPDSVQVIDRWLRELVDIIEMKRLMGPYSIRCEDVGNVGCTGIIVISTSHASIHVWPFADRPFAKWDVYSCRDFKPSAIADHLFSIGASEVDYTLFDRSNDNGIEIIESNSIIRPF